ncbi:MAG: hypothetical protein IPL53_16600 [Ignavibacteria bacterium]|nr:hypothetical protein [Ignavibacteria bacterium]
MKLNRNLSGLQLGIFILLICCTGVLGYLFYDSYRTNIQNRELIADAKIENKDLSQDLDIIKDKHESLKKEVDDLKIKVKKVSYKKKSPKKKRLYSAGKNSKYKKYYKKGKVSYKKLYYDLKKKCSNQKSYKGGSYKKSGTKYSNKNTKVKTPVTK